MPKQVKSRKRVQRHGEVFTNDREVNAMLNMVKQETERIESRFLEPACGNGNFLTEVLKRKLNVVDSRYRRSLPTWEKYAFIAASSIYGVELLSDNVVSCRIRLLEVMERHYTRIAQKNQNPHFLPIIKYVLEHNILNGNALTLKTVDNNSIDTDEPIIFTEWSIVVGDKVKRREFRLDEMLEGSASKQQFSLFGASGTPTTDWEVDNETGALIPKPIQEYPPVSFYEVINVG